MRILVGIDSRQAAPLLSAVDTLVGLRGQEVVLVYVHDTGVRGELEFMRERMLRRGPSAPRMAHIGEAEEAGARAILSAAEGVARQFEAQITAIVESGEPGRVLVFFAGDQKADLLVVGARSGDISVPAGPRSLGHTARFVVDHSPCPVLLLRAARSQTPTGRP
jgi:nucleotide-binding universal stress UspA family protein